MSPANTNVYLFINVFLLIFYIIFFRDLGENMTDDELRAMIDEFDKDGDGESKLNAINLFIYWY